MFIHVSIISYSIIYNEKVTFYLIKSSFSFCRSFSWLKSSKLNLWIFKPREKNSRDVRVIKRREVTGMFTRIASSSSTINRSRTAIRSVMSSRVFRQVMMIALVALALVMQPHGASAAVRNNSASANPAPCAVNTYYRVVSAWEVDRGLADDKGWEGILVQYDQDANCNRITSSYHIRDWTFDVNAYADETVPTVGLVENLVWSKSAVIWNGTFWDPRARVSHSFKTIGGKQ